jgi:hydrogenase maturation protease
MNNVCVVGVGNPFRRDDGAGWAVIDEIEKRKIAHVELRKNRADPADFLDIFSRYSIVFVIDACMMDAPLGSWQRIDALNDPIPSERAQTSTHGFSLSQIIALGQTLRQLPSQLILYAINGKSYRISHALSLEVARAIPRVTQEILREIHQCMKDT